jgi:hypothetical protein
MHHHRHFFHRIFRHMVELGTLIVSGLLLFLVAAPVLILTHPAWGGFADSLGTHPWVARLFAGWIAFLLCRRYWRRHRAGIEAGRAVERERHARAYARASEPESRSWTA